MIKKSVFEDELIAGMQKNLTSSQNQDDLIKAIDYLQAASEILEEAGMVKKSEAILSVLAKIASHTHPPDPNKINDRHTKGLTPDKMINNLKHHGTVFNMANDGRDDQKADDLLNLEIGDDIEVSDENGPSELDFEDEI
jgi:hypothetical protein